MTWSDPRSAHSWHFHRRLLHLHVLHLLHGHFSKALTAGQVISTTFDFPAEESFQAFSRKRTMERLTRLCGVMTSQAERPWLAVWHVHGATYDTGCRWVVQTGDKSRLCFVTSAAVTGLTVWPVLTCYCDQLWTGGTERAGLSFIKLNIIMWAGQPTTESHDTIKKPAGLSAHSLASNEATRWTSEFWDQTFQHWKKSTTSLQRDTAGQSSEKVSSTCAVRGRAPLRCLWLVMFVSLRPIRAPGSL